MIIQTERMLLDAVAVIAESDRLRVMLKNGDVFPFIYCDSPEDAREAIRDIGQYFRMNGTPVCRILDGKVKEVLQDTNLR